MSGASCSVRMIKTFFKRFSLRISQLFVSMEFLIFADILFNPSWFYLEGYRDHVFGKHNLSSNHIPILYYHSQYFIQLLFNIAPLPPLLSG